MRLPRYWFRSARTDEVTPLPDEFETLARYNAEVARGIVHTREWKLRMAELQVRFDDWARRR